MKRALAWTLAVTLLDRAIGAITVEYLPTPNSAVAPRSNPKP